MNRLIALGVFILVLATGASIWLWLSQSEPEAPAAPLRTVDYATPEAWTARPAAPPAAVWESGWAVDVFLVLASAKRSPAPLKSLAARDAQAIEDANSIGEGLASIGPVYAPVFSSTESSQDIVRSFKTYVDRDNRGRAFVIATDQTLPADLADIISADSMLRERFGGVLWLAPGSDSSSDFEVMADGVQPEAYCPERLSQPLGCVATVLTARKGGRRIIADQPPIGGAVMDGFREWLETSAVQLAEPLGELEDVAIIDIRRPGETDPLDEAIPEPAVP